MRRNSRWTQVYVDIDPVTKKNGAYVRLVPNFMDVESAGLPHGLSLAVGGQTFPTQDEANAFADNVDRFMDAMASQLIATHNKALAAEDKVQKTD